MKGGGDWGSICGSEASPARHGEGTTVDYFERSLHSTAEIKVCAELIYGGFSRASSLDGGEMRSKICSGQPGLHGELLIGRFFVTSFNRNRESGHLSRDRPATSILWVDRGNVSQCSALRGGEKEILSGRDLGNFISVLCATQQRTFSKEECVCQEEFSETRHSTPGSPSFSHTGRLLRLDASGVGNNRWSEDIIR